MIIDPFEAREFVARLLTRDILRSKLDKLEASIRKILPGIDVDAARLVYYSSNSKKGKPLSGLPRDPAMQFKMLPVSDQQKLLEKINNAIDLEEDEKKEANDKTVQKFVDKLMDAVKNRNEDLVAISDTIAGIYNFDVNFDVVISNHPLDVVAKSSGQGWSAISSEKLGDPYQRGIFSDVENGSAVAFLVGKKNGVINARVMLRVCSGEKDRGMGIETSIYYDNGNKGGQAGANAGILIAKNVKAKDFYAYIVKILDDSNLSNYKTCITPYIYKGYSDVAEKHNTIIEYKKPRIDTKNVLTSKSKDKQAKQFYK